MAIKKVTLEKVSRFSKDKDGNALKTKDGKSYERVLLTVAGKTISGFGNQSNADWKAGDEVQIDIVSVEKDGKTYYNFNGVNATTMLLERVTALEKRLDKIESNLNSDGSRMPDFGENKPTEEPPVEAYKDIDVENLPF